MDNLETLHHTNTVPLLQILGPFVNKPLIWGGSTTNLTYFQLIALILHLNSKNSTMNLMLGVKNLAVFLGIGALLLVSTTVSAGNGFGKSPYRKDHNPINLYYFGYNVVNPGFAIGTEVNLSWTKMEKSGCKGSRISDRQFVMIPTIGMFQNEASTLSVFGDLEFNYSVTYRHGLTLSIFGAPGYAQMLEEGPATAPVDNAKGSILSSEAHSGFMPMAGAGIGYDFQKINGKDFPLEITLRGLATSTDIANLSIFPSFQTGLTYSF